MWEGMGYDGLRWEGMGYDGPTPSMQPAQPAHPPPMRPTQPAHPPPMQLTQPGHPPWKMPPSPVLLQTTKAPPPKLLRPTVVANKGPKRPPPKLPTLPPAMRVSPLSEGDESEEDPLRVAVMSQVQVPSKTS